MCRSVKAPCQIRDRLWHLTPRRTSRTALHRLSAPPAHPEWDCPEGEIGTHNAASPICGQPCRHALVACQDCRGPPASFPEANGNSRCPRPPAHLRPAAALHTPSSNSRRLPRLKLTLERRPASRRALFDVHATITTTAEPFQHDGAGLSPDPAHHECA